jgi:hypothetical protein
MGTKCGGWTISWARQKRAKHDGRHDHLESDSGNCFAADKVTFSVDGSDAAGADLASS